MISNIEAKHEKMYRAHNSLTAGAALLHEVATGIYADCRHQDTRTKFADAVKRLEEARDAAERAWKLASDARIELIRLTGCDGTCSDAANRPAQLKTGT